MLHAESSAIADLERVRELANSGAPDLAILEGIRSYAHGGHSTAEGTALLNDLAVLRHQAGDVNGAWRILERAAADAPGDRLVRENREALAALGEKAADASNRDAREAGPGAANPWVLEGLRLLRSSVDLLDRDVLELGGSTPPDRLHEFATRSWTAADLAPVGAAEGDYRLVGCDAAALPFAGERFDTAFSVCAFEHFDDIDGVLREVYRVLRPGGSFFTQFAPIWSCAVGHHVWVRMSGTLVTFNDRVIPDWAHLYLNRDELQTFLALTLDEPTAERVASYAYRSRYINRRCEREFQRAFESSEFEIVSRSIWGGRTPPSGALQQALAERWPGAGDLSAHGIRVLLRKPA